MLGPNWPQDRPMTLHPAALAAIESLMTGTAGAAMSGKSFDPDQELIAQGGANMVMPWFGGVPSSAAISLLVGDMRGLS